MSSPAASKQAPIRPVPAEIDQAKLAGAKSAPCKSGPSKSGPSMSQLVRGLWAKPAPLPADAVIIHDPDARRPHDLDDPFFDRRVQSRIAEAIAQARRKK